MLWSRRSSARSASFVQRPGTAAPSGDVFTGRPFIYRRTPEGFVLYSVGDNLKDDGGRGRDPDTKKLLDFVVQYPMGS
jgi:hypothetical protein